MRATIRTRPLDVSSSAQVLYYEIELVVIGSTDDDLNKELTVTNIREALNEKMNQYITEKRTRIYSHDALIKMIETSDGSQFDYVNDGRGPFLLMITDNEPGAPSETKPKLFLSDNVSEVGNWFISWERIEYHIATYARDKSLWKNVRRHGESGFQWQYLHTERFNLPDGEF